jgi:FKBP-type peptidyl-prolyl cis-trans isomerase
MKTQNFILAIIISGLAWSAHAADIAGKWVGEFESQVGHQKYVFNFQTTGDKLKAEAEAESDQGKRHVEFIDVKLSGDTLTFAENRQIQDDTTIRIDYTGKVEVDGDKIQFTRKVGDFGSQDFPAKREAAAATTTAAAAPATDISGVWHAEFDSQIGLQKYDYTLKVDGGKVTGKANSEINDEKRETELTEGKLVGDTVTFVEPLKFGDNDIRIEYTGKIKDGEIAFHRKVADLATEDFVAKRKTASAVPASGSSTNSMH